MKYIIDIDGTICTKTNSEYEKAEPLLDRIFIINSLYDEKNEIHYWTARGSSSGKDWTEFTKNQLSNWGCKYNTLKLGKPTYDIWVDDKALSDVEFFNSNTNKRILK